MSAINYAGKDYKSFKSDMISELKVMMPEYTAISETDAGIVIIELVARGLDVLSEYQDRNAAECFLATAEQRSSVVKRSKDLGHTPRAAIPAVFRQVFVLSAPRDTDTLIPTGLKLSTQKTLIEESIPFEVAADLVIPAGKMGDEVYEGDYLYTTLVEHGTTVSNDFLGVSTGAPGQTFSLSYKNAIQDTIAVFVNEGSGAVQWERVDTFLSSGTQSLHFIAETDEYGNTTITFGDGANGRIPQANPNGIYSQYRVGGGDAGNVGAYKINVLNSSVAGLSRTFNPDEVPVIFGQEIESIQSIKVSAPAHARAMYRAVTPEDFQTLTLESYGAVVKSCSAMYAGYPTDGSEDVLNLYFYPYVQGTATSIEDFFSDRLIVGTTMKALEPTYKQVELSMVAEYYVTPSADLQSLMAHEIAEYINELGVGEPLVYYDVESKIAGNVPGVKYVRITSSTPSGVKSITAAKSEKIIVTVVKFPQEDNRETNYVTNAATLLQENFPDLYAIYTTL